MARIARRTLLTTAAAWPLATLPLRLTRAGEAQRVLVLVELNGGNDGLNTVVPYADPGYRRARPSLAVARDQLIPLDNRPRPEQRRVGKACVSTCRNRWTPNH